MSMAQRASSEVGQYVQSTACGQWGTDVRDRAKTGLGGDDVGSQAARRLHSRDRSRSHAVLCTYWPTSEDARWAIDISAKTDPRHPSGLSESPRRETPSNTCRLLSRAAIALPAYLDGYVAQQHGHG